MRDVDFWATIVTNWYYENNMNTFDNTLVVMLELTVVNNWHIISDMYVRLSSGWSWYFFLAFYLVAVLLVVNVLIAFILDAFITQINVISENGSEVYVKRIMNSIRLIPGGATVATEEK
eukprot:UN28487